MHVETVDKLGVPPSVRPPPPLFCVFWVEDLSLGPGLVDEVWLAGQQVPGILLLGFPGTGLPCVPPYLAIYCTVLETELRDGCGLSANTLPAGLSPQSRENSISFD